MADVVLLERKQLTCGTTWHAAGLIGQLRATQNLTRLARYSAELYHALEAETGVATGMRRNGSITVALTGERMEEMRRQAALARAFEVEVHEIGPAEIKPLYPHLKFRRSAACSCRVMASAIRRTWRWRWPRARASAAPGFSRASKVTDVRQSRWARHGVAGGACGWRARTSQGTIEADVVVNCAGMWARDLAAAPA